MAVRTILIAVLLGLVQGVLEWLPISSEGILTILLTMLHENPTVAVRLSLVLHLGTALAAAAYYRGDILELGRRLPVWRSDESFDRESADLTFLGLATLVSGMVGIVAYRLLIDLVTVLAGGTFIVLIGGLLILTGVIQRVSDRSGNGHHPSPEPLDAILVGAGQGLAVLPGISRSGTTLGILLLRGYEGESAFRLSFLLSIPAALGAATLIVVDAGGVPGLAPLSAFAGLGTAAIAGYLTIDALMRAVRRIPFWAVCLGIGVLAVVGGVVAL